MYKYFQDIKSVCLFSDDLSTVDIRYCDYRPLTIIGYCDYFANNR